MEKAIATLRLVGIESRIYVCRDLVLCLQPFETYTFYGTLARWEDAYLRTIIYKSVDGLMKGVNQIVRRRQDDPEYLKLPFDRAQSWKRRESQKKYSYVRPKIA